MFQEPQKIFSPQELENAYIEIKAEFDRDKLCQALDAVSSAQADSDINFVQIVFAGKNKVVFSSVSHNLSIKYEFETPHTGIGVFKVSGKQFSDYVKQLPSKNIQLKAELPYRIQLRCAGSSAKIQLVQDQSLSNIQASKIGSSIVAKGKQLERWVSTFKDFALLEDSRFYAKGSLIWAETSSSDRFPEGCLNSVTSDAHRLAKATLHDGIKIEQIDTSRVLIPKRALDEIKRVSAANPEEEFNLKWHEGELSFSLEMNGYLMSAKCIAGQYPPYESAFPQKINTEIMMDYKAIQESVRRALIFADKNRVMKLHFENSLLTMASFTPGQKEGEEVIEIGTKLETPFDVNYNGHLLSGILSVLQGTRITFAWESVTRPVKIMGDEQEGIHVFYLLVPTRF
jgi:DNA polymerase III sliding clamp (beta) subunit (PCNA family)